MRTPTPGWRIETRMQVISCTTKLSMPLSMVMAMAARPGPVGKFVPDTSFLLRGERYQMRVIMRVVTIAFPHNKTMKEIKANGTRAAAANGAPWLTLTRRWIVSQPDTATKCDQ